MAAAYSGSVPILRALVAGGPGGKLVGDDVNAEDTRFRNWRKTALDYALDEDHVEFASVLRDEFGGKQGVRLW